MGADPARDFLTIERFCHFPNLLAALSAPCAWELVKDTGAERRLVAVVEWRRSYASSAAPPACENLAPGEV